MNIRFATFLACSAILLASTRVLAAQFADVTGTPYETAFTYLSQKGIIQGYANGEGRPNDPLNRVEAIKVLLELKLKDRVDWYTQNMLPLPLFSDVDQNEWYAPYVEAAFEANMVMGYPDQTFRPAQYVRVEEAIAMTLRAYNVQGTGGGAELSPYMQNRDNAWFTPYINAAITMNLVMHQGRLELGQVMSRGRFFDLVYRLDKVQNEGSIAFQDAEPQAPVRAQHRVQPQIIASTAYGSQPSIHAAQPALRQQYSYASEQYFSITMPSLGVEDLTVTHPSDPFSSNGLLSPLQLGVGHLFSYPGGGGKIMIYGHSSGYPWDVSKYTKIFRKVNKLAIGDRIYVTYDGKLYTYEVNHKQTVSASDTSPFQDSGLGEELILYTCWPPDSISQRYLVHAIPVSAVALR